MANQAVEKCSTVLAKRKLTLAFAESATAGRLCMEFSLAPESGEVLKGGIVCYNACIKEDLLKVPPEIIKKYTPESQQVTEGLAKGLRKLMDSDIQVAITGLTTAGGSETAEKPVGTMFIHLLIENRSIAVREEFKGSAQEIITQTVNSTAGLILRELKE